MLPLLHTYSEVSLSSWYFEPVVISATFIAVSFYFYGVMSQKCFEPWRAAAFLLGVTTMVLSLVSPIDAGADKLLSMHMLQHVFLTTVGPPLVLLGLPPRIFGPILNTWLGTKYMRVLLGPVVTATLFVVNMWLWHVPPVYEAALTNEELHNIMHFAFLGTGVLYWWPVIQPAKAIEGRIGDGGKLLYLFATGMPMALLAVMFFASGNVIYDYYDQTNRLWNVDPMDDQQIAGLIMGALGEAASFVAITLLFFRFLESEENAEDLAVAAVAPRRPADVGPTT